MKWLKELKEILSQEPEEWLAYLHGQQLDNLAHIKNKRPKYCGVLLQFLKFFAKIFLNVRGSQDKNLKSGARFVIYAGTKNQFSSLEGVIDELQLRSESVITILDKTVRGGLSDKKNYISQSFNLFDVIKVMILLPVKTPALLVRLKRYSNISVSWYLSEFLGVYGHLVYFYRVLKATSPEFVITSNDHNVPNRCLLAVAHFFGVKTVYLQHASVSALFPALRVNYAFLDGQCALDTYILCERNQPETERNIPYPRVILSGQKKKILKEEFVDNNVVGVAINVLDNCDKVIDFVEKLLSDGREVRLRWHPGQPKADIEKFRSSIGSNSGVILSDPKVESISDYFSAISCLVAGNSSIHLEAALAGILPIYFELSPPEHPDYYGYVKHKLALYAETADDVLQCINKAHNSYKTNAEAVRYYSSTYQTQWDGKEGQLVAECLQSLSNGKRELPVKILGFNDIVHHAEA